jgi:hypothetical protein
MNFFNPQGPNYPTQIPQRITDLNIALEDIAPPLRALWLMDLLKLNKSSDENINTLHR